MPEPTQFLPGDPEQLEQALADAIRAVLIRVPTLVNVHTRERAPQLPTDDVALSTTPDPAVGADLPRTNVVEIGDPLIDEHEHSGDDEVQTTLAFTYPIYYTLEFVDEWPVGTTPYRNSTAQAKGVYMKARRLFKQNRTLDYHNVLHFYLQRTGAGLIDDDETDGKLHSQTWSLRIVVSGCKV